MARSSTIRVKVVGDIQGLNKSMDAGQTKVEKFSSAMGKLKIPILLAAGASFKLASDFDSSMSKITGLVGIAADEVDSMGESLKGISGETAKGPAELAEALFFVTSAGLRGADAMDALEFAAKASTAGLGETADVADALTSAMNAYAKSGLSAEEATNILVATVREGKLEASELGASIGQVLPIASEMGVTFDEVGASIAAMTRLGLNSAESVTSLKSILSTLAKPGQAAAEALERAGLSAQGLRDQIREKGLLSVLHTLREAFGDNQEELTKVIPNVRALTGFMALTGDSADATNTIFENLTDTTGALDGAFDAASETIEFRFNKTLADLQVQLLGVREPLTRFAGQFLPALSNALGTATNEMTLAIRGINAIKDGVIDAEGPTGNWERAMQQLMGQFVPNFWDDQSEGVRQFAASIKFMGGNAARSDESLRFMIDALELGGEDFLAIAGDADQFSKAAGLTGEELRRLLAIIKLMGLEELAQDFETVKRRTQEVRDEVLDGINPAFEELTEKIDEGTDSLSLFGAAMRAQKDPSFALISTTNKAAEAQSTLNDARLEFGVGSSEFLEAALAATNATADQAIAQQAFIDLGPQSAEAFRKLLENAGLYGDELEVILDTILRMAGAVRDIPPIPGSSGKGISQFHSGGIVPGPEGRERLAFVEGGETIRTPEQEAAVHKGGGGGGGGGGATVIVQGSVFGTDLEDHVVIAIERAKRRGRL